MSRFGLAAAVVAALSIAHGAAATSITVTDYNASAYTTYVGSGTFVGQDFETIGPAHGQGEVGADYSTNVGTFNTLGGTGTGNTVTTLSGDTGNYLALRDGDVYGRSNLWPTTGQWFLDSNDTYGLVWDVATGGMFSSVAFLLSDASDQGAYLRITADGATADLRTGDKLSNGNDKFVVIDFGGPVSSAHIVLGNYKSDAYSTLRTNDGFGIDGALVRVSTVPLPPTLLLLGAGFGLLGFGFRRRAAA